MFDLLTHWKPVIVQRCKCVALCGQMKYLLKFILNVFHSSVEAKRGIEFRHSTRNAPRIRQKIGNSVLTLSSLCPYTAGSVCVRDAAWS